MFPELATRVLRLDVQSQGLKRLGLPSGLSSGLRSNRVSSSLLLASRTFGLGSACVRTHALNPCHKVCSGRDSPSVGALSGATIGSPTAVTVSAEIQPDFDFQLRRPQTVGQ